MGRGGAIYLSYTALLLLSTTLPLTDADNIWAVSIDQSPAPPPDDGPPFSAHADRNPAHLPYEIIGIVAAYFAAIFIFGTLVLAVGRPSRKRALNRSRNQATEMVKPAGVMYDPSPVSPASGRSWFGSPRRARRKGASASASLRSGASDYGGSPNMGSVVSFDQNVVEQDRLRREQEMERLYAAVMAQDDRKSEKTVATTTTEVQVPTTAPPEYQQGQPKPPRLITDAPALRHLQTDQGLKSPRSPGTPKSPVRAIYPPDAPLPPMPTSPTSPIRAEYPPGTPLSPRFVDPNPQQPSDLRSNRDSRHSSLGSNKTVTSTTSATKKARRSLRHLKISAPLQSYARDDDNSDGARTPLSPRFYTDPGVLPEPPTPARTLDSQHAPTTPATARSWRDQEEDQEAVDQVRDLPRPHLTRAPSASAGANPAALTTTTTTTITPANPPPATGTAHPRPLPLRQLAQHQQPTPAPTDFFPLSNARWRHEPFSAGPVKTTFLDVRRDQFSSGAGGGPRTGVPTPYSPYMPFSPVTPVTPRLVSRAERKARARERERGAGVVEEMVEDEGRVWGGAY